jgi:hypothetical protein
VGPEERKIKFKYQFLIITESKDAFYLVSISIRSITWRVLERNMSAQKQAHNSGGKWTIRSRSVSSPQEKTPHAFL